MDLPSPKQSLKQTLYSFAISILKLNSLKMAIFALLTFCTSQAAFAQTKLPGNVAIHIAKTHYEHPVRLLHPYLDFWHMKGPLAYKAALKTLPKRFVGVSDCKTNAQVVLLLEPHMFYNPQLRVFHAEFIARAYTNAGESITRIKKQAQQNGDLNVKPDFYMEKAYAKAMDKIIKALETDKAFLATLDQAVLNNTAEICDSLDKIPTEKFYY